jgi:DNA-binding winged helix-turn-helix (wHTH) protein
MHNEFSVPLTLEEVSAPPTLPRSHYRSDKSFSEKRTESAGAAPAEVSFGPFRLLPAQFLLLEGDKPLPLGSRALGILTVLLERPGELISKQELMVRVWPNIFVVPANLTVHISALRRVLRDGRDGNRFIINIPGRGYGFVAPSARSGGAYGSANTITAEVPVPLKKPETTPDVVATYCLPPRS